MKATGVVRRLDNMGRFVLPISLRRSLGLTENSYVHYALDGENIVLTKVLPTCYFCGGTENVKVFREKKICAKCIAAISRSR